MLICIKVNDSTLIMPKQFYLCRWLVNALLDGDWYTLVKLGQLQLFFFANTQILELRRAGKDANELNFRELLLEQPVVCIHCLVGAVVVACNSSKISDLT